MKNIKNSGKYEKYVNVEQFADMTGYSVSTVQTYIFHAKIASTKMGTTRLIPFSEVERVRIEQKAELEAKEREEKRIAENLKFKNKQRSR